MESVDATLAYPARELPNSARPPSSRSTTRLFDGLPSWDAAARGIQECRR